MIHHDHIFVIKPTHGKNWPALSTVWLGARVPVQIYMGEGVLNASGRCGISTSIKPVCVKLVNNRGVRRQAFIMFTLWLLGYFRGRI